MLSLVSRRATAATTTTRLIPSNLTIRASFNNFNTSVKANAGSPKKSEEDVEEFYDRVPSVHGPYAAVRATLPFYSKDSTEYEAHKTSESKNLSSTNLQTADMNASTDDGTPSGTDSTKYHQNLLHESMLLPSICLSMVGTMQFLDDLDEDDGGKEEVKKATMIKKVDKPEYETYVVPKRGYKDEDGTVWPEETD